MNTAPIHPGMSTERRQFLGMTAAAALSALAWPQRGLRAQTQAQTLPDNLVISYPDGARLVYDHKAGALNVTGVKTLAAEVSEQADVRCKTLNAEASSQATLRCPTITLDGNVTVTGKLTYQGGLNGQGDATLSGNVTHVGGKLSSNGVTLHTHTHGGVTPGGAITTIPLP